MEIIQPTPTDTEKLSAPLIEDSDGDDVNTIALNQVLELDSISDREKYKNEIGTLLLWAKETTKSNDHKVLQGAIRALRARMGNSEQGDVIKNLSRLAYLDLEK